MNYNAKTLKILKAEICNRQDAKHAKHENAKTLKS